MAEVAVIATIISAAASVVSLAMTLSMKPDKPTDNGSAIDRKGQDNPKVVPFGKCLVPSVRVFNNVHNEETERLVQVHSFGVGQLKSIEKIYIDSVPVAQGSFAFNPNQWYTDLNGQFPNLSFGLRLGRKTEEVFPHVVQYSDGQWDNSCRGDRTASMSLEVYRRINENGDNNIRLISDTFKVEALVHGNAVIDPRFDTSLQGAYDWTKRTWINSGRDSYRNPACVVLTYLLDDYYGLGLPVDSIDLKSFVDLANYCDHRKLTFDGFIDQGSDFGEILIGMATSFDGVLYVEDGLIKAKADKESPAVVSIDMDDLVNTFKLSNASDSSYYNIVSAEFVNEETNYTKDKYVLPSNIATSEVIKLDGFEKTKNFTYPYTLASPSEESNIVKYLANKALKKARNQKTIEFSMVNTEKTLNVYDVFEITQPDYGLDKAKFRVDKIVSSLVKDTTVSNITATEYTDSLYDNSDYEDGVISPPIKPPTLTILSPTNLSFEQTGTGKGLLKWQNRHYKEHRVVVVMDGKQVASISGTQYLFENLEAGTHTFKLRAIDTLGATSDWVELRNQLVVAGQPLPTVTGLSGQFNTKTAMLTWNNMKEVNIGVNGDKLVGEVFSHYEVIISENGKYHSTHLCADNFFNHNATHRLVKAEVRVVDVYGNRSATGAVLEVKNPQCIPPSGLKVDAVLSTVTIRWDAAQEEDYIASDVHISRDGDFLPTESTLAATSTSNNLVITDELSGVYYVRVGNYDFFGKDEMVYSPAISFTSKTVDDLLENSNAFQDSIEGIIANAKEIETVTSKVEIQGTLIESNKTAISGVEGNLSSLSETVSANYGDLNGKITTTNQVVAGVDGKVEALTQIKHDVNGKVSGLIMGNDGETSTFDVIADKFRISSKAGDQAVFQVDSASGKTVIKDALIGEIGANKITTGVMDASRISASSTLTVGSGNASAKMSGSDSTWRISAGNQTMGSAPFRVDKDGKMYATNADVVGKVTATSGNFKDVNIEKANVTGTVTLSNSGSNRTRIMTGNGSNHAIDIYKGNDPKFVLRHNGQLQMWNNSGVEVVNFNPDANSYTFKGTVHADTIVGDLVSAKLFNFGKKTTNGTHTLFSTTITNRSGKNATVIAQPMPMNCYANARHYGSNQGSTSQTTTIEVSFRDGHSGGSVLASTRAEAHSYSRTSGGSTDSTGPDSVGMMSTGLGLTIPAGASRTIVCVCTITGVGKNPYQEGRASLEATQNTVQFFRDGGAFS